MMFTSAIVASVGNAAQHHAGRGDARGAPASKTTTFAALIAALGLVIGTAGAGAFPLELRPFSDFISAGGCAGFDLNWFLTVQTHPTKWRAAPWLQESSEKHGRIFVITNTEEINSKS